MKKCCQFFVNLSTSRCTVEVKRLLRHCQCHYVIALFQGLGTDETAVIEIMCTSTNEELAAIKAAYEKGKSLSESYRSQSTDNLSKTLEKLHSSDVLTRLWILKSQADIEFLARSNMLAIGS